MYKCNYRNHKYFIDLEVLGERCRIYRKKVLKMNSYELAKRIGCSQATLCLFENGKTNNLYVFLGYINEGFVL